MLLLDAFEDFMCGSILDKMVFCLREKQSMIANDDCNSWYNKVHVVDFFGVGMGEKEILYCE